MITRMQCFIKNVMLNSIASSYIAPPLFRKVIYKICGFKIGNGSEIFPQCFFGTSGRLIIGDSSFINYRCFLDLSDDIYIGDNVAIGFDCKFITSLHEIGDSVQRASKGIHKKIIIEDGCWIGANVTIMPGITISSGCIIGANSLVTKDTVRNGLYFGIPAKRIKELKK